MTQIQIDYAELKRICLLPEKELIPQGSNYYFQDNGSKILAVAHCDYICTGTPDFVDYIYKGVKYAMSETLDDRLGVYLITSLLKSLKINVDILLTTDEERGASTASEFDAKKEYNWIFSFDRRGHDIVAYDYDDPDLRNKVLKATGTPLAWGSFSDIVSLQHLKVKGLNFGCGYYGEHSPTCYATERAISSGVSNFLRFHDVYKDTHLPHTPKVWKSYGAWGQKQQKTDIVVVGGVSEQKLTSTLAQIYRGERSDAGYCPFCHNFDTLVYDSYAGEEICDMCADFLDKVSGEMDEVKNYCEICTVSDTMEDCETITIPFTKENRYLCSYCQDYVKKHADSEDTIKNIRWQ